MLKFNGVHIVEDMIDLDPESLKTGDTVLVIPRVDEYPSETEHNGVNSIECNNVITYVFTQGIADSIYMFSGAQLGAYVYWDAETDPEKRQVDADYNTSHSHTVYLKVDGKLHDISNGDRDRVHLPSSGYSEKLEIGWPYKHSLGGIDRSKLDFTSEYAKTHDRIYAKYTQVVPLEDDTAIACCIHASLGIVEYFFSAQTSVYLLAGDKYYHLNGTSYSDIIALMDEKIATSDLSMHDKFAAIRYKAAYPKSYAYMGLNRAETKNKMLETYKHIFAGIEVSGDVFRKYTQPVYVNEELEIEGYVAIHEWGQHLLLFHKGLCMQHESRNEDALIWNERRKAGAIAYFEKGGRTGFNPYTGEFGDTSTSVKFSSTTGIKAVSNQGTLYYRNIDDIYVHVDKHTDPDFMKRLDAEQDLVAVLQE